MLVVPRVGVMLQHSMLGLNRRLMIDVVRIAQIATMRVGEFIARRWRERRGVVMGVLIHWSLVPAKGDDAVASPRP
jgi:hypothetical protein